MSYFQCEVVVRTIFGETLNEIFQATSADALYEKIGYYLTRMGDSLARVEHTTPIKFIMAETPFETKSLERYYTAPIEKRPRTNVGFEKFDWPW